MAMQFEWIWIIPRGNFTRVPSFSGSPCIGYRLQNIYRLIVLKSKSTVPNPWLIVAIESSHATVIPGNCYLLFSWHCYSEILCWTLNLPSWTLLQNFLANYYYSKIIHHWCITWSFIYNIVWTIVCLNFITFIKNFQYCRVLQFFLNKTINLWIEI